MEIKHRDLFKKEIIIKYDKIDREIKLDFKDVLIKPKPSSVPITRADVNLNVDYGNFTGVPLIISEMVSIGTYKIAKALEEDANGDFESARNAAIEGINDVEKLLINHTEAV